MYASVDLLVLPDGHNVQHFWCCNLSNCCRSVHFFQWNESEHEVLHIIIIVQIENSFLSGPFHLIKLLSFSIRQMCVFFV